VIVALGEGHEFTRPEPPLVLICHPEQASGAHRATRARRRTYVLVLVAQASSPVWVVSPERDGTEKASPTTHTDEHG
jgi:hypothetical protein